jgi:hypothetical protein
MRQILLLVILSGLLLPACRTLRVSDFTAQNARIQEPLPRMGFLVHQESFGQAFDRETFDKGWNGNVANPYGFTTNADLYILSDLPLEDAFKAFDNEVSYNLSENSGPRYGHVRFKLINYERRVPGWGYSVASWGTLFVGNALGMPYNRVRSEMELQVEIADANKNVLARYRAPGIGKAYTAMYYGYQTSDAWRKANLNAIQDAMKAIRPQIIADAPRLRAQLLEAGPIPPK